MKISRFHQKLAEEFPECIDDPERYLGPNYCSVLNFWIWLENNLESLRFKSYEEFYDDDWDIQKSAEKVVGHYYQLKVFNVIYRNSPGIGNDSFKLAASWAVLEILASHELLTSGHNFSYLKEFQNYENS